MVMKLARWYGLNMELWMVYLRVGFSLEIFVSCIFCSPYNRIVAWHRAARATREHFKTKNINQIFQELYKN